MPGGVLLAMTGPARTSGQVACWTKAILARTQQQPTGPQRASGMTVPFGGGWALTRPRGWTERSCTKRSAGVLRPRALRHPHRNRHPPQQDAEELTTGERKPVTHPAWATPAPGLHPENISTGASLLRTVWRCSRSMWGRNAVPCEDTMTPSSVRPPLKQAAPGVFDVIRAHAAESERQGRFSSTTLGTLHEADLFRILQPASCGGPPPARSGARRRVRRVSWRRCGLVPPDRGRQQRLCGLARP